MGLVWILIALPKDQDQHKHAAIATSDQLRELTFPFTSCSSTRAIKSCPSPRQHSRAAWWLELKVNQHKYYKQRIAVPIIPQICDSLGTGVIPSLTSCQVTPGTGSRAGPKFIRG